MKPQAFQLQQYVHLSNHIIHAELVGVVGLKAGAFEREKMKIITVLGIALWKTYGVGWGMKVSSMHYLISVPDAVVCENLHALPASWKGSRIF